MASSSSTLTTKLGRKHHVFLSFRGEDTRVGFTSHLHDALEKKYIPTFIDDDLKRGEEITDSLVKAIEDSMLSVIIFCQYYASSQWCLDELVKILECRKIRGQIAIPIFYKVDPSNVRNQSGSFGNAFTELVKRKALEMEEERCFRAALNEAANISGHDSWKIESESKFIDEIVKDIVNKLCKMFPIHPVNLVGIDERIRKIESFLEMESQDVRIVGIWGMGGMGKTTIAGALYNKICTEFEAFLFVPNVREELKRRTVVDLQRSFVSRLLDQEIQDMGPLSFGNHFIIYGLRHKKVLIGFDDVDSSMPLQELLLGPHDSFGPGSRILVTSRDQHVLKQVVDATYEVEALNNIEALQLFKSKAFKKIDPTSDHKDLSERIVNYAKGNPLALVVLGSALYDRSKEDWYSALNGLRQIQNVEILNVLRISYDGLNKEEKNIFLDVAYFFRGMDRYHVTRILEKKSSSVHYCMSVLIDKSLMTTTFDNRLEMHDLLRDMAYSIVSEESENPRKRSRLVDPEDIYHVLKQRKGTKAIKGIRLDMPESREMLLKSDAFAGMRCLEFLIIKGNTSKLQLPHCGLGYLSNMLRYFRWDEYPSRSLPQNFCAENLVEFDFFGSKFEKLWSGQQNLVNLRRIELSYSQYLTKLPDLSKANKLQYVDLEYCDSLTEVPSCFQYFENLEYLFLDACYNLQRFPKSIDSNSIKSLSLRDCSNIKKSPKISTDIEFLDLSGTAIEEVQQSFGDEWAELFLSGCSNIIKFPEISGNMIKLCLDGTSIKEVPSSIQFLTNMQELYMTNCKKLSRLPSSICKLKSLEYLDLSGCSKLKSFPNIMEPMESLKELILSETAIRVLPSSIQFLTNLRELYMTNCKKLSRLPRSIQFLTNLQELCMTDCTKLSRLPGSICKLKSLEYLYLSGCSKLESFPEIMKPMESLKALSLRETSIRELPSSIKHLKHLHYLYLDFTLIKELPELPPSLEYLTANNCESLEIISSNPLRDSVRELGFANCFKFDHNALMADMQLKIQLGKIQDFFGMVLPGSEIPQWFSNQSTGSSITIQFPANPPTLKSTAFCLVVVHPDDIYEHDLQLSWQAKIRNGEHDDVICSISSHTFFFRNLKIYELDHMYLSYNNIRPGDFSKYFGHEVTFEFYSLSNFAIERHFKVKRCGIHLQFDETLDPPSISHEDK